MKPFKILALLSFLFLVSCDGFFINKYTSQIGFLNFNCSDHSDVLDTIIFQHRPVNMPAEFTAMLKEFDNKPFTNGKLVYFDSGPRELIKIDNYSVRYAYNPEISEWVIDGLSIELSDQEQFRITARIQLLVIEHQCQKGKFESLLELLSLKEKLEKEEI